LKAREATGKFWIRTSGSGGGSTSYRCTAKPAKLTVDVAKKARLSCELSRLSCTDENPPGRTCLDSLFVNQTSESDATLKVTYLDHFGVNARQRRVALGPSSSLVRSASTVEASWSSHGHELKLGYRGGITYTGTFTIPNGGPQAVQCNDLAMLD
jgi:hypothetical protein